MASAQLHKGFRGTPSGPLRSSNCRCSGVHHALCGAETSHAKAVICVAVLLLPASEAASKPPSRPSIARCGGLRLQLRIAAPQFQGPRLCLRPRPRLGANDGEGRRGQCREGREPGLPCGIPCPSPLGGLGDRGGEVGRPTPHRPVSCREIDDFEVGEGGSLRHHGVPLARHLKERLGRE